MDASLFGGFLETLRRPRMIAFSSFAAGAPQNKAGKHGRSDVRPAADHGWM
jgi:hypothetical protein